MFDILQVTAQYSNAVLVAIMPHISDFAAKVDLPIIKPVTTAHVRQFVCSSRGDQIGGRVILTNGYEFAFLNGHVGLFRSQKSYYSLQDPTRIPQFYGEVKLSESQAVDIARDTIRKLGYSPVELHTDQKPLTVPPPTSEGHKIPRYRIAWLTTNPLNPDRPRRDIDFEINAANGNIEMLTIRHPSTFGPQPKVDVKAPILTPGPRTELVGGVKMERFTPTYSNVFLKAVLSDCQEFIRKTGFEVKLPITTNDIDWARYECGIDRGDPTAQIDLKTKDRFLYSHGQVVGFFAHDVENMPGEDAKMPPPERFGPINMTVKESTSLVTQAVLRLGYSVKDLHMGKPPEVAMPKNVGPKSYSRCFIKWTEQRGEEEITWVSAEVDVTSKKLKYLYIDDRQNHTIWRDPPKSIGSVETEKPRKN